MALRVHLIRTPAGRLGSGVSGKTACGVGFFIGRGSSASLGEFEALNRIGGVRAHDHIKFEPDRHSCATCRSHWGAGMETEAEPV